jgi:hypothetical protein
VQLALYHLHLAALDISPRYLDGPAKTANPQSAPLYKDTATPAYAKNGLVEPAQKLPDLASIQSQ